MDLLNVSDLSKVFGARTKNPVAAVRNATFSIRRGEVLGLVGESGCGKTTLGKVLLKLEQPTSGQIVFDGADITQLGFAAMRPLRRRMQMVFQGSYEAFNPFRTVRQVLAEPLGNFGLMGSDAEDLMRETLARVDLGPQYLDRYPHEMSGGQRQRVGIARALILKPDFVVCDEITSSIDYSVRARILDLMLKLKHENGLTYLFISHDTAAVSRVCDRVMVMYLGHVVEIVRGLRTDAVHPYTRALMAAALLPNPHDRTENAILFDEKGGMDVPKQGCVFYNRCLRRSAECAHSTPPLREIGSGHSVACHRV